MSDGTTRAQRCLVVVDEPAMRASVMRTLRADGFDCAEAASGLAALRRLEVEPFSLMLSDYQMPGMNGGALLRETVARWPDTAVVIVTGTADTNLALRCLDEGALDFLPTPFTIDELRARVRQAQDKQRLLAENRGYQTELEARVTAQARKYEELSLAALQSLADALEVKDAYTWGHSIRVSRYAIAIARELGLAPSLLDQIEFGSRLHDIGKIGVRESVLNKQGMLTEEEYAHVMEHPVIGWRLLAPLMRDMPHALSVVRSHHERIDGRGAPDRLRAGEIPIEARITAVADSFDAMTSGRPYQGGVTVEDAVAELRRCAGSQFCAECVAAFERALASGAVPRPDWTEQRPSHSALNVA